MDNINKDFDKIFKIIQVPQTSCYCFYFPQWLINEYKNYFTFKDNEIYYRDIRVYAYPNEII